MILMGKLEGCYHFFPPLFSLEQEKSLLILNLNCHKNGSAGRFNLENIPLSELISVIPVCKRLIYLMINFSVFNSAVSSCKYKGLFGIFNPAAWL